MPRFNITEIKALKKFLYNDTFHDAELENLIYNFVDDNLKIEALNPMYDVRLEFVFRNIETALAVKGDWIGTKGAINSLTIEDNFLYLQNYIPEYSKNINDFLYLVFQMFSGDEIHIVCKEVIIEII